MAGAVTDPSGCLCSAMTIICAPGLMSSLLAGGNEAVGGSGGTLAVLVLDHDRLAVNAGNRRLDVGVGHGAARLPIPREMPIGNYALLRLHEDVKADRFLATVRLWHRGDADERTLLDVGKLRLDH